MEKWQQEIEELLKREYSEDELKRKLKVLQDILDHYKDKEQPAGDEWDVIRVVCHGAVNELAVKPLFYAAFQLGIAYERYKNAQRSSGKS